MSVLDWYLLKAEQCELKAKASINLSSRARYEDEQKLWRKLAEREAVSIFGIVLLDPDLTVRRIIH
jgi:hypothetical protein